MRTLALVLSLVCAASSMAAPPPMMPAEEKTFYDGFFAAFPSVVPASLSTLEPFVDPNLAVYVEGKLEHRSRAEWFAWLQGLGGHRDGVEQYSMSREEFFLQPNDRVFVHEFWMPMRDGSVYHPEFPHRFVSYEFKNQKLVRVDYLADVRPTGKFGKVR